MNRGRNKEICIYDDRDIFVERLHEALIVRGMKEMDLVRSSKASRGSVSRYMTGHGTPTVPVLQSICRGLNVSADYLLGFTSHIDLGKTWIQGNDGYFCPFCNSKGESWYSYCPICGKEILIEL